MTIASNAHTLLTAAMAQVMGGQDAERRGNTREARGVTTLVLTKPRNRMHCMLARGGNPWVTLAEFPWLIAGRNDLAWLSHYLPRAVDFSDNGRTWRAGYGPRLRAWPEYDTDQLGHVIATLKANPASRRAVVSLWNPDLDNKASSMDYPCTLALHFQGQHGALDLAVFMRSNDIWWGLSGVNLVNFTLLQELVAHLVGLPLGHYTHVATNLHAYERHFQRIARARKLGQGSHLNPYLAPGLKAESMNLRGTVTLDSFTKGCQGALDTVTARRGEDARARPLLGPGKLSNIIVPGEQDHWLGHWAAFMLLHEEMHPRTVPSTPSLEHLRDCIESVSLPTWRLTLAAWVARTWEHPAPDMTAMLTEVVHGACLGARHAAEWAVQAVAEHGEHG